MPESLADSQPWYHEGLRFECTGCGDCCTGAPGFVWVGRDEIKALAAALGMSIEDFQVQYVRQTDGRKSLVERSNGDCVFFDAATRQCVVYHARPLQCRTWPFWQSNLRTRSIWRAISRICPGCDRGRLYSSDEIRAQAAVVDV
jgi:Fe-S-cluster containining protein